MEKINFLRRVFGGADVSRDQQNVAVRCPNPECRSRLLNKRKFSIHVPTDRSHCWVCGFKTGKSLISALRLLKVGSVVLQEYVAKYQTSSLKSRAIDETAVDEPTLDFPKDFRLLSTEISSKDPNTRHALKYLQSRGLTERDMWYWKLGISEELKFKRRIIVPSFDADGDLNFYTARSIDAEIFTKYVNADVDKVPVIFNELNIDWKLPLTIVEGPFDLVKCDENATCLQGSELTADYLLFWKIVQHKTPIILALDDDALLKTQKHAKLLKSYEVPVQILPLQGKKDVGEMSKTEFLKAKETSIEWTRDMEIRAKISSMKMNSRRY